MSDKLTPEKRSWNMSRIKGKDTKIEVEVRKYLFSKGLRYRKNVRKLPGCPDIVLPKYKTVVFVNGCFWHHHDCSGFVWPKSNLDYWKPKIERNEKRDRENYQKMTELGWKVIVVWECELKKEKRDNTLDSLYQTIISIN